MCVVYRDSLSRARLLKTPCLDIFTKQSCCSLSLSSATKKNMLCVRNARVIYLFVPIYYLQKRNIEF